MFDIEKAILGWRRKMTKGGLKDAGVLAELENHLREDFELLVGGGSDPRFAFDDAAARLGQAGLLREEFARANFGKWDWLRKIKGVITGILFWRIGFSPRPPVASFTDDARESLQFARGEAVGFRHDFIGTEHLLLGLINTKAAGLETVLDKIGLNQEQVRIQIQRIIGDGLNAPALTEIPFTPRARRAMSLAEQEARRLRQPRVGVEHLFLGLLLEGGGVAAIVLQELGIDTAATRAAILGGMRPGS